MHRSGVFEDEEGVRAEMSVEEVERLANALISKWHGFPESERDLESVIRTTVADTWLVMDGFLSVEDFER